MDSIDSSKYLIETPGKKPRISPEGIWAIEEERFNEVKKELDKNFTPEQRKVVKALLFLLGRGIEIKLDMHGIFGRERDNYFNIFLKEKKVGEISYNEKNKTIGANDVFNLNKRLKGRHYGTAIYIKILIQANLNGHNLHSSSVLFEEALNVWKRLTELNLAYFKTEDGNSICYFKDLSFLTKEDFEKIYKILNK